LIGLLWVCATPVFADDLEGRIESIDPGDQSFVVQGIRFFATPSTDYDDDLSGFGDLKVGLTVEVDFEYRGGRHVAKEIEHED
jgi:hypothetical protein